MELIDSHAHFDDSSFEPDRDAAYQRAVAAGVTGQILPAVTAAGWPELKRVASRYPGLHAAYGLHPMFLADHRPEHLEALAQWLDREDAVAVGECGLDFYVPGLDPDEQIRYFDAQLSLSRQFDLPVIIHARRAVDQVIKYLRRHPGVRGVIHSFAGSDQQARQLIDLGFCLGFGGPITYPRANRLRGLVATLPLEAMLLETDAPDQPDSGHRGERNEPAYLPRILAEMAELRGATPADIAAVTTANTRRLFALPA